MLNNNFYTLTATSIFIRSFPANKWLQPISVDLPITVWWFHLISGSILAKLHLSAFVTATDSTPYLLHMKHENRFYLQQTTRLCFLARNLFNVFLYFILLHPRTHVPSFCTYFTTSFLLNDPVSSLNWSKQLCSISINFTAQIFSHTFLAPSSLFLQSAYFRPHT